MIRKTLERRDNAGKPFEISPMICTYVELRKYTKLFQLSDLEENLFCLKYPWCTRIMLTTVDDTNFDYFLYTYLLFETLAMPCVPVEIVESLLKDITGGGEEDKTPVLPALRPLWLDKVSLKQIQGILTALSKGKREDKLDLGILINPEAINVISISISYARRYSCSASRSV